VGQVGWPRLFSGGLPLTVFLTALFYLQGRAFRSGYLEALGFNTSQFPVDTTEALWLAYNGWLLVSLAIFENAQWPVVVRLLAAAAIVFATVLLLFSLLWLLDRFLGPAPAMPRSNPGAEPSHQRFQWKSLFKVTAFATLSGTLGLPLALAAIALTVMIPFLLLVYPFHALGKKAAIEECDKPQASAARVTLTGDASATAYLIECSDNFCALVNAHGSRLVVSRQDVKKVEIPASLGVDSPDASKRCHLPMQDS